MRATGPRPTSDRPLSRPVRTNQQLNPKHDEPMKRKDLYFALRCGMVATGSNGENLAAGRVTLVNWENQVVLDTFVKVPPEEVFDYRTKETGITAELLAMTSALHFKNARAKVGKLLCGKILVGHGLEVDLGALRLAHPSCDMRDTTTYLPYMRKVSNGQASVLLPREMDDLMVHVFGRTLNADQPTLVREALGCMELYKHARVPWERELINALQQKEKQREMIMNMRRNSGPQLSAIRENDALVTGVGETVKVAGSQFAYYSDKFEYEDSTFTTVASTAEPVDDSSESSSYLTQDTDLGTRVSYGTMRNESEYVPAHIDNMSDISSAYDLDEHDDFHEGATASSRIWAQSAHIASSSWGDETTGHTSLTSLTENAAALPIAEEELRGRLPAHLLADIENDSGATGRPGVDSADEYEDLDEDEEGYEDSSEPLCSQVETKDKRDYGYGDYGYEDPQASPPRKHVAQRSTSSGGSQRDTRQQRPVRRNSALGVSEESQTEVAPVAEEKKKGWFSLGRRRRSMNGSSLSSSDRTHQEENSNSEPLTGSDRTHQHSRNLLSNDQWLDTEVGPPKFSMFGRNSISNLNHAKSRSVRPPPGFGS